MTSWTQDQVRGDDIEEDFRAALAAYRAAEGAVHAVEARTAGLSFEAEAALEEAYGEAGDAMYEALRLLLKAPAPDVGALAVKLELVVRHEVGTLTGGEACLEAVRDDALRLAVGPREGPSTPQDRRPRAVDPVSLREQAVRIDASLA